jgi:hypothetical protein
VTFAVKLKTLPPEALPARVRVGGVESICFVEGPMDEKGRPTWRMDPAQKIRFVS